MLRKTSLRGRKRAGRAEDRLIGESPRWVSLPVFTASPRVFFFLNRSLAATRRFSVLPRLVFSLLYVHPYASQHTSPALARERECYIPSLRSSLPCNGYPRPERSQSGAGGTCPLHRPPVPALISNMSSIATDGCRGNISSTDGASKAPGLPEADGGRNRRIL